MLAPGTPVPIDRSNPLRCSGLLGLTLPPLSLPATGAALAGANAALGLGVDIGLSPFSNSQRRERTSGPALSHPPVFSIAGAGEGSRLSRGGSSGSLSTTHAELRRRTGSMSRGLVASGDAATPAGFDGGGSLPSSSSSICSSSSSSSSSESEGDVTRLAGLPPRASPSLVLQAAGVKAAASAVTPTPNTGVVAATTPGPDAPPPVTQLPPLPAVTLSPTPGGKPKWQPRFRSGSAVSGLMNATPPPVRGSTGSANGDSDGLRGLDSAVAPVSAPPSVLRCLPSLELTPSACSPSPLPSLRAVSTAVTDLADGAAGGGTGTPPPPRAPPLLRRHSVGEPSGVHEDGVRECLAAACACNDAVFPTGRPPCFLGTRGGGGGSGGGGLLGTDGSQASSVLTQASVRAAGRVELVPIDHGLILPHHLALDDVECAWRMWPQCRQPLSAASKR